MTNDLIVSPAAYEDTREQARCIKVDNPVLALRFIYALNAAYDLLAKDPKISVVRDFGQPELAGLRMWPLRGWFDKHLIFYRQTDKGIEIVRLLHASQDIKALLLGKPSDEQGANLGGGPRA